MASRNGIAIAAPSAPRRNVRRGRCFFVTIIDLSGRPEGLQLRVQAGLKTRLYERSISLLESSQARRRFS
jgi:hypothetical protein